MTTDAMGWQDAIITVLEGSESELHYQRITEMIGEQGLRTLSGATPAATVNRSLHQITDPDHNWYDRRVQKLGRGVYRFSDPEQPTPIDGQEPLEQDPEEPDNPDGIVGVPAFGLYWDKDSVRWGRSVMLGRQTRNADTVNFADQKGVYILHNGRSVVYVGRASDGTLYSRLSAHARSSRNMRWDKFSWFGFRDVDDKSGDLMPLAEGVDTNHLIAILESVLIESLEPPVNGRRGDYLGTLYEQVPDPEIAKQQSQAFLQRLAGA